MTSLSIYALNLVTGLGLGLAIDWSLFIVSRYREELAVHGPGAKALRETLRTAGRTVLFSSLTVAAALASLLVFPQSFLRSMGLGGMLVSLIGAGVALIFLPAVLALLGRTGGQPRAAPAPARVGEGRAPGLVGLLVPALAHRDAAGRVVIAAGTATLLLVLGLPFTGVRFTGFDPSVLPKASSGRQVDKIVHTEFATDLNPTAYAVVSAPATARPACGPSRRGSAPCPAGPRWRRRARRPRHVADRRRHERDPELERRAAPRRPDARGAVALPDARRRRLRLARRPEVEPRLEPPVRARDPRRRHAVRALPDDRVDRAADQGDRAQPAHDRLGVRRARVDLPGRAPAGTARLLGQGGIDTTQPILIAAVAFGLSTDYGVFLLTRIKEARDGGADNKTAVAFGLERTGRIVTAAACLFIVAIGAFAASRIVTIKEVGLGTGLAVLIDATLVRALLVPSLMMLLGRANWWAPRPLRWATTRISFSG